jgi:ABC-type phosphate transport system substrate-binding protein
MRHLAIILLLSVWLRLDGAVAVVDPGVAPGALTKERVRDLLLGRVTTWSNGEALVIVLCASETGDRAVMSVCARSVSVLQRGWKRLVFSGTGAMPMMVETPQAAVELVRRTPGAITLLGENVDEAQGLIVIDLDPVGDGTR